MRHILICILIVAFAAAGCAGPDTVTATESPSEREYPTGSNIPRKKGAVADANSPSGMGVRAMSTALVVVTSS